MLSAPLPGTPVRIHYRPAVHAFMPLQGRTGVVLARATGRGPRNHLVEIDGWRYTVPAGNLFKL